jgi:putative SOS response-associated peptidase YedK
VLGWLHNRIPCLLTTDETVAAWLDPATPVPAARAALQLPPAETISWHPVATAVGNVRQCAASGIKFFRNGIRLFNNSFYLKRNL